MEKPLIKKAMANYNNRHIRKLSKPVHSKVFEVVGPYKMRERLEEITEIKEDYVLLETRLTGICHADLRYVSCSRPPEVLKKKLPLCVLHEGVARIMDIGDCVKNLSKGDLVIVVPNIPCYIHNTEKYSNIYRACKACRPEGPGENLCEDVKFIASNAPGLCRTHLVHPASCVFPVPKDMPEEIATLSEPLTVINRALKKVVVKNDDRVAVLGGGFMGFIAAATLSKIIGVSKPNLLVTDIFDSKLDKFKDFATTLNTNKTPIPNELVSSFNIVFECAGGKAASATIDQSICLLNPGGTCVLVGVSEDKVPIETRMILEKGLIFIGTTRSAAIDYPIVLKWLEKQDFSNLLKKVIYPQKFLADSYESIIAACRIAEKPETHGKVMIKWYQDTKTT
jgi:ribitol-5-phosphate 2-dehydrogenase